MSIIPECFRFLSENASGEWHESYRFKDKDTDEYLHPVRRDMLLLRVETGTKRAMYWIYNIQDAIRFNEFVGMKMKAEAHEIITTHRCRLFFDIDLSLDEFQKNDFAEHYGIALPEQNENQEMDDVGKQIANVFKDAVLISLEEHGLDIDTDLSGFDFMFTMRNRILDDDGFKISIHLITNLIVPLKACSAIINHIKTEVLQQNLEVLGINENMVGALVDSIDEAQYRRHGSLSLPYGSKRAKSGICTNWIYHDYSIPNQRYFITIDDQFSINEVDLSNYNIADSSAYAISDVNPEFVKLALQNVHNIKDYNSRVWDINASILKRSTMYVKRYAPSMCSICKRTHESDNTLFLIFNSERGTASWKCARNAMMKPIVFFQQDDDNSNITDDVESFASKYSKNRSQSKTRTLPQSKTRTLPQEPIKKNFEIEAPDDVEAFATKHSALKVISTKDIEDPFDKAPYRPKKSFMNKSPIPKQYEDTNMECDGDEYDEEQISIESVKPTIPTRVGNRSKKPNLKDEGY